MSLSHAAEVVGHRHRGGDATSEAAETAAPAASATEPVQPARQAAGVGGLLHGEALHGEPHSEPQIVLNMAVASVVALTSSQSRSNVALASESEMMNEMVEDFVSFVYCLSQFCRLCLGLLTTLLIA